jgi:hypothetical protein
MDNANPIAKANISLIKFMKGMVIITLRQNQACLNKGFFFSIKKYVQIIT